MSFKGARKTASIFFRKNRKDGVIRFPLLLLEVVRFVPFESR